ncbi:hypothetical protein CkaCkLH20_02992 [Colletotrichum karsti]|uniref:Uncharacterized protein n=1 Tax=Colletotrichum karsti TaxID=1095194 RepID=A0A9P6LKI8_9PEZI|nr:uncharacterized protein CkaCkLH20_02992 [Colletotrichum karsti]KAF9879449.1 hypothetical protein CkaCkLH20_02992 [Colletotrichum karsti]
MSTDKQQDPKKWGFKIDHHPQPHHTPRVVARHICAPESCYHDDKVLPPRPRSRERVVYARRRPRTRGPHHDMPILRGGDECTTHPKRGRRRTLLFDEYEAYPRGGHEYFGTATTPREETPPARMVRERRSFTPTRIVRESGSRRRSRRRRRGGDGDDDGRDDEMVVMHGALVEDGDRRGGGYGGRRRERSWERRSDPDDRIGEIDDRTEHSYVMGERREDPGRRMVRFQRS